MTELSNQEAVDKARAELDAAISEDTKNNAEIQELLSLPKKDQDKYALSIDVFGKIIRIKPFIPVEVKRKIETLKNQDFETDLEMDLAALNAMYEFMGDICLDAPWTNPESWKYIDQQLGISQKICNQMTEEIKRGLETRKSFRRKR